MKKILILIIAAMAGFTADAQFAKASLQASGLTCSMCSKAVKEALEKVPFVEKVMVNIKTQEYSLTFSQGSKVSFDDLSLAVEDAGFSVASLKVTANVEQVKAGKDEHVKIGDSYFHFLNGEGQTLEGPVTFTVVDKSFVTEKEFKKYSGETAMECVKTGKAASCCKEDAIAEGSRVYHVII